MRELQPRSWKALWVPMLFVQDSCRVYGVELLKPEHYRHLSIRRLGGS